MSEDRPNRAPAQPGRESESSPAERELPRRSLLKILGGAAGVAAVTQVGWLSGCAKPPEPPPVAEMPLSSLPEGERVRALMGPTPIEVIRAGDEVTARSLWCTHLGCEVKWNSEQKKYFCPCHEGIYDSRGFPISGPPPRRLHELHVSVADGIATITEEAPEELGS